MFHRHWECFLVQKKELPFVVAFRYPLLRGFTFDRLEKKDLKEWQNFLDKVSQMSYSQVRKQYMRTSDKNDRFFGEQILHFAVSKTFRVHGVIVDEVFCVLRLGRNHKVHNQRFS